MDCIVFDCYILLSCMYVFFAHWKLPAKSWPIPWLQLFKVSSMRISATRVRLPSQPANSKHLRKTTGGLRVLAWQTTIAWALSKIATGIVESLDRSSPRSHFPTKQMTLWASLKPVIQIFACIHGIVQLEQNTGNVWKCSDFLQVDSQNTLWCAYVQEFQASLSNFKLLLNFTSLYSFTVLHQGLHQ